MWRNPSQPVRICDWTPMPCGNPTTIWRNSSRGHRSARAGQSGLGQADSGALRSHQIAAALCHARGAFSARSQADEPDESQLVIGSLDGNALLRHAVDARQPSQEPSGRYDATLAFAANADALPSSRTVGIRHPRPRITPDQAGQADGQAVLRVTIDAEADEAEWRLGQASNTFQYPPLAVVKMGQHWRAAGLGTKGVWVVEEHQTTPLARQRQFLAASCQAVRKAVRNCSSPRTASN